MENKENNTEKQDILKNEWTKCKQDFRKSLPVLGGFLTGLVTMAVVVVILCGGFRNLWAAGRFTNVLSIIELNYVADYDVSDITDAALTAAVDSLDDNWSFYMTPEYYEWYKSYSSNTYVGIGVTVSKDEETGGFLIEAVTDGKPAQTAGLAAGDIILTADGQDMTGEDIVTTDLRTLIQSNVGGSILLTVQHADGTQEEYTVECISIYESPVSSEMLDGNVGYIRIANFHTGMADDAIEAVDMLIADGAGSLVFDLRDNPGGSVDELTKLLDYLLPAGDIFVRVSRKGAEKVVESDADCIELPMAVIVNGDSYSAAEYFAAALSEYDWATIVGENTTGKARSQVTIQTVDNGAVHVSRYGYLTPNRIDLYEQGGLTVDVPAELSEDQQSLYDAGTLAAADDAQVQAAVSEVIKS